MIEPNLKKITIASTVGHFLFFLIAALTLSSPPHVIKQPIVVDILSPESKTAGTNSSIQKMNKKVSSLPAKTLSNKGATSQKTVKEPVKIRPQPPHTKKVENTKPLSAKKAAPKNSDSTVKESEKVKPQVPRTRSKADGTKVVQSKKSFTQKEKKANAPAKKTKTTSKPLKKKEIAKTKEPSKTKKSDSSTKAAQKTETASKQNKKEAVKKKTSSGTQSSKKTQTASKPDSKKQSVQNESAAKNHQEEIERLYALKAAAAMKHKASMLAQKNGKGGGNGSPSISVTGKGSGPANDGRLLRYFTAVQNRIKDEWVYPGKNKGNLENSILLKIGSHGEVIVAKIERSSGDSLFDKSTLRAIDRANPFPAPPRELKEEIVLRFSP